MNRSAVLPSESDAEWHRRFGCKTIPELFAEQVNKTPDAAALRDLRGIVTYRELQSEATYLATRLQARGVLSGQLIAIGTQRTRETIITLLAVLQIGAAYTALDPSCPPARATLMLADARPVLAVSQTGCKNNIPDPTLPVINLDTEFGARSSSMDSNFVHKSAPAHARPSADDLAYVSFTSGSTGAPKGVCIPHRAVIRLVKECDYVTIAPSDIILRYASLSFDASTFEIWGALLNGASIAIFPPETPSLQELGGFIESAGVSILWLSAGIFHQMADGYLPYLHKVRQLIAGGDVLSVPHVGKVLKLLPHCRLINGYGPTENTTFSCCHQIEHLPAPGCSIPIGKPIARTYCRIIDEDGFLVKRGQPGELYVGGVGLALGYLADPELTEQKFVVDSYGGGPAARLYRTGDRVRELADGCLEFLGRLDRQVKISGLRVSLDEVEATIAQHTAVRENAVHLRPGVSGYEQLNSFIALKTDETLSVSDLRDFLRTRLPDYMIPRSFRFLPNLPLNASGKVDRGALHAADREPVDTDGQIPSEIGTKAALSCIWREVLGFNEFATDQNFFDIGGTSLSATHMLARIHTVFGKNVPMGVFLKGGTVDELVRFLDQCPKTESSPIHVFRHGVNRPALFCLPSHGGNLMCYANMERHFTSNRPVYGIQSQRFLGKGEGQSVEEIASHCLNVITQRQPEGPYHLFGFCFGGLLAYEIASQLSKRGAKVGLVAVFDYTFPGVTKGQSRLPRMASLAAIIGNAFRGLVELFRLPRAHRQSVLRRVRLRIGGLLRGKGWDEAYRIGVQGPNATDQERQDLDDFYVRICREYLPSQYFGRITLLRERRLPISHGNDPTLGWSAVAGENVEVQIVEGLWQHGAALEEPYVADFTRAIETNIADAETQ